MEVDPRYGHSDEFFFYMENVTLAPTIANSIRTAIGSDIETYAISPETIDYHKNTSVWDGEMISHQISFIPTKPDFLDNSDLNMLELKLDTKNNGNAYRYVFSREFTLKNKETDEQIPINKVFICENIPVFSLGPNQEVSLSCQFDYKSKRASDSRHQSATAGIDYADAPKGNMDPEKVLFNVNIQVGIPPKKIVSLAFQNLIDRLQKLQEGIKTGDSNVYYLQLNKYYRYDFVFIGENHTIGSLIEKWNNRHDLRSVTGYRITRDNKAITIDYGLSRFTPEIFERKEDDGEKIENLLEKSLGYLNGEKEKEQREFTVKAFLENLLRLEKYLTELQEDWNKVKVTNIPIPNYIREIEKQRIERLSR